MQQLNEVKNCYNQTAEEYANTFFDDELTHKSFDRMVLNRLGGKVRRKSFCSSSLIFTYFLFQFRTAPANVS
jgi:hypothetical protein